MSLIIDNYLIFGFFAYLLSFAGSVSAWILVILVKRYAERHEERVRRNRAIDEYLRERAERKYDDE